MKMRFIAKVLFVLFAAQIIISVLSAPNTNSESPGKIAANRDDLVNLINS